MSHNLATAFSEVGNDPDTAHLRNIIIEYLMHLTENKI